MKIELAKTEIIHFVGIGGIGMSGLALIMNGMDFKIQGSDISLNKNIERLKKNKTKIFLGHKKNNIKKATILVISSAIKKNNPEIIAAKKKNLPIYKRGDMLAHIVSLTKNIVVTGSHGKTTTTSLIASIFSKTKLDPTIINGGVLNSLNNSAKLGKSNWCILELDESDGSFVKVPPTYSIITNIDREHMDYYKSMEKIKGLFLDFIKKVPSFGKSFICIDDQNNNEIIKKVKIKNFYTYGTNLKSQFQIKNIDQSKDYSKFNIHIKLPGKNNTIIKNIKIPLLGLHNIRNATAAAAVAITIGISKNLIKQGLKEFKGVQRRFNKIFSYRLTDFYDDYAHHPSEIKEVLSGVKAAYKKEEIICIFQPHRISRLKDLRKEFSLSFKKADTVILCPIYSAGEKLKLGFSYLNFAKDIIKNSKVNLYLVNNEFQLSKFIKQNIYGKKIVIGMGAGSISSWMKKLPNLIYANR
jgi:UDP-N-acetylmuramate--alanine ligase